MPSYTDKYPPKADNLHLAIDESGDDFKYSLLRGHAMTDGTWKTDEQLRMEYITRTDSLIYQMTNGVYAYNPETKSYEDVIPDVAIFLDKSARPLAWLTRELWDKLAPETPGGEAPKKPDFRFLNIDRQQWVTTLDPEGVGSVDVNQLDPTVIRSLRSIFIDHAHKQDGLTSTIDSAPTELDDKTVLIIDEVKSTGRTLEFARAMLLKAFPKTKIATTYWMDKVVTLSNGARANADLPVWYRQDTVHGRGVNNRYDNSSNQSSNRTQRLGAWFLSTRFPTVDKLSTQLRKEIHHLASDPQVPYIPTTNRDDYEERVGELNNSDRTTVEKRMREIGRIAL